MKNLAEAEAYAATTSNLPSFEQYLEGVEFFQKISRSWYGLPEERHFSVNRSGYYESCDNAYGGLYVDWAFHKEITKDDIVSAYIELCTNDQELASEWNDV